MRKPKKYYYVICEGCGQEFKLAEPTKDFVCNGCRNWRRIKMQRGW